MFSATRSGERVSGSLAVSFFIVSSFLTASRSAAALRGLDALEFQVQLYLPRHLLLLRGGGPQAGHLRLEPRALLQALRAGRRGCPATSAGAKLPVSARGLQREQVSIQP